MRILYTQGDGAKLVFSKVKDDIIYGYVIRDGKSYEPQPIEQILARGYWEVAEESNKSDKVLPTLEEALKQVKIEWKD